ncbi:MAG: signal recognition particle protein [Ruminococcaceae bacterium]|jgi:signal recognition particle subunit SRP54|nr:signal recognition particle protein [Oscillospiraceae bacterium]
MFDNLSEKLENAFKRFRNKGKLTEADVRDGMREVQRALLEADVNYKVTKAFVKTVTERAVGSEVLESLLPGQQVVKIVHEELVKLMGETNNKLVISPKPPTVVMMVGLQGTGKTTHAAKLSGMYRKQGKRPLLVACDVYRPAAIDQLKVVGASVEVPVFEMGQGDPVEIAKAGVEHAKKHGHDMVFIDTAGRLQIDDTLMTELENIKAETEPTEILLVVDAMTGQAAVDVAKTFNDRLDITGVVLSKLDGDTRGGAALATRYVTGKPIKFVGTGEKMDAIEPFYPDRMASRILGMGDVLTLIEKAQQAIDDKKAAELEKKLRENNFTLNDYLEQFRQIKNMGSLDQLAGMIPGLKPGALKDAKVDEKVLSHTEAIILSMTDYEREYPDVINGSRRRRIAAGSGTSVEEVNRLMKQYDQMNKMIKQLSGQFGGKRGKKRMKIPFPIG